jgi:hypothetical protein
MHPIAPVRLAPKLFFEVLNRGMIGIGLSPHLQPRFRRRAIAFRQGWYHYRVRLTAPDHSD